MLGVGLDFDVQIVVAKQIRLLRTVLTVAHESRCRAIRRRVGRRVAAGRQRNGAIEELHCVGNNGRTAPRVVILAALAAVVLRDHIGAIQRVIETAPARVRGIQREAGVAHRDHELRPGNTGDLGIDALGGDFEWRAGILEIANLAQELQVLTVRDRCGGALLVPCIDRRLQRVAAREQGAIEWCQLIDEAREPGPECGRVHGNGRQQLVRDEGVEAGFDLKAACLSVLR